MLVKWWPVDPAQVKGHLLGYNVRVQSVEAGVIPKVRYEASKSETRLEMSLYHLSAALLEVLGL